MATMYCVKCRAKRDDPNAEKVTMKNGKPALKGKCPTCGTGMYKIGGQSSRLDFFKKTTKPDAVSPRGFL